MATQTRGQPAQKRAKSGGPAKGGRTTPALFVRQVIAELRKVIWPTRRELRTYTIVALTFVLVMVVIVTSWTTGSPSWCSGRSAESAARPRGPSDGARRGHAPGGRSWGLAPG